jgi:hypothetical protein
MEAKEEKLALQPTLFSTEGYQALHGRPVLKLSLGNTQLSFFRSHTTSADITLQQRAPFLQSELQNCQPSLFEDALKDALNQFKGECILYKAPPAPYTNTPFSAWSLNDKAQTLYEDVNYHLQITPAPFADTLPGDQRRTLSQMHKKGHKTEQASVDNLTLLYQILAKNRAVKGYPMSISLGALWDAFIALPNAYRAYLHLDAHQVPVGAAIVVKVTSLVWYTYMLGHLPGASGSPILALLEAIYHDAYAEGAAYLDLGTASVEGELIQGLAQFKRSIGGIASTKATFVYSL